MRIPRVRLVLAGATVLSAVALPPLSEAQTSRQPSVQDEIRELRRLIEQQQQVIDGLQKRLNDVQSQQSEVEAQVREQVEETKQEAEKPLVASANPRMRLALSGQVDRLLNLADDGKSTKAYFVDNNISVSRIGALATGQVSEDLTLGANFELAISPNNSADVSQTNEDGGQNNEFRKVEALFKSKTYGDVSFGKGDPATKDITRLDLSGTDVLAYARTGDPAGGLLFRTSGDDELTDTNVNSVFTDFDSGRTNRLRYDTPKLKGAFASASYGADQKWGVAARWAGTGHGLRATAGAGVQDPSRNGVDVVYQGSASVLHEATGLNLTYATAFQDQDEGTGQLQYVKLGWQHDFLQIGDTAFSIDFGYDKDTPGDGDTGKTVGLVALQNLSDYGTQLFAGFRGYDFDAGDGPSTSTIYVATAGSRIKF